MAQNVDFQGTVEVRNLSEMLLPVKMQIGEASGINEDNEKVTCIVVKFFDADNKVMVFLLMEEVAKDLSEQLARKRKEVFGMERGQN